MFLLDLLLFQDFWEVLGMLSDEKFFDKADKFALYPSVDDQYFTLTELASSCLHLLLCVRVGARLGLGAAACTCYSVLG